MNGAVLVLNTGSSSIKFTRFGTGAGRRRPDRLCEGRISTSNNCPRLSANDGAGRTLVERDHGLAPRPAPAGTGRIAPIHRPKRASTQTGQGPSTQAQGLPPQGRTA